MADIAMCKKALVWLHEGFPRIDSGDHEVKKDEDFVKDGDNG